jgi:hypothetical protein
MSNEKVEFELGFVDSPDSGRQLQALADQVEKTQQRMSASVQAFATDMQASVREITTAASQSASPSGGGSGPSAVSIAKKEAEESVKHNKVKLKDVEDTARKSMEAIDRQYQSQLTGMKKLFEQQRTIIGEMYQRQKDYDRQVSQLSERRHSRERDTHHRAAQDARSYSSALKDLGSASLDAGSSMAKFARGVALFSGSESDNMEKLLRTIMKIQGAMDLMKGAKGVMGKMGGVNNALGGLLGHHSDMRSAGLSRGYELQAARGLSGALRGASSMGGQVAASSAASAATSAGSAAAENVAQSTMGKTLSKMLATNIVGRTLWNAKGRIASGGKGLLSGGMNIGRQLGSGYSSGGVRGMMSAGQDMAGTAMRSGISGRAVGQVLGGATGNVAGRKLSDSKFAQTLLTMAGAKAGSRLATSLGTTAAAAASGGAAAGGAAAGGGAAGGAAAAGGGVLGSTAAVVTAIPAAIASLGYALVANSNASNSEGMTGGIQKKFTVGGMADKGGQVIAKTGNALNNMIGAIVGASRSFDMLGIKATEHARQMALMASVESKYTDRLSSAQLYRDSEQEILKRSNAAEANSMIVSNIGSSGGQGQFRSVGMNNDMTRYQASKASIMGREAIGPMQRKFMRGRESEAQANLKRARSRQEARARFANEAVDDAKRNMEEKEAAAGESGLTAAQMREANAISARKNAAEADLQQQNKEYRESTNRGTDMLTSDITGEANTDGSDAQHASELGEGEAYRSGLFYYLGMKRETTHEEKQMTGNIGHTQRRAEKAAEEQRQLEAETGTDLKVYTEEDIQKQENAQREATAAYDEFISKQQQANEVLKLNGRELIEYHKTVRETAEQNITLLEQEKIARANLRKDNQASMGTMGEAQRAEFMTAARKLDQGNMDDLTNQEIEMLKNSGRLGEDSTAQLDEEQRQRYRNNVSAEDQDMLNRLDNKEAMDQRTDAEIGNQLQTQQEANDEIIASAEDQGLAGQENNLKIIDATNISVALEDNLDAITYRTVTQVIEALEKRNQILADRITDEVVARMNAAGEGRKEGDMTNAGNAMALNN